MRVVEFLMQTSDYHVLIGFTIIECFFRILLGVFYYHKIHNGLLKMIKFISHEQTTSDYLFGASCDFVQDRPGNEQSTEYKLKHYIVYLRSAVICK